MCGCTSFRDVRHHLEVVPAPCLRVLVLRFAVEELGCQPLSGWAARTQVEWLPLHPVQHQGIPRQLELHHCSHKTHIEETARSAKQTKRNEMEEVQTSKLAKQHLAEVHAKNESGCYCCHLRTEILRLKAFRCAQVASSSSSRPLENTHPE